MLTNRTTFVNLFEYLIADGSGLPKLEPSVHSGGIVFWPHFRPPGELRVFFMIKDNKKTNV